MSKKTIAVIMTLILNVGLAGWDQDVRNVVNQYPIKLDNTFSSTLLGLCYAYPRLLEGDRFPIKTIKVPTNMLDSRGLNIKVGLVRNKNGKINRDAPYVFVITGAFNNLNGALPKSMMNAFLDMGYNTVVIPNPWGTEFIKSGTRKPVGTILYEAEVIHDVIKNTAKLLLIDKFRLFGISYGSFLAAMVSTFNAQDGSPYNILDTTIISPPVNMGHTLENLDVLVSQTKKYHGASVIQSAINLFKFCQKTSPSVYRKKDQNTAKGLVVSVGFHGELINSVTLYDDLKHLNIVPKRNLKILSSVERQKLTHYEYYQYQRERKKEVDIFDNWVKNYNFSKYFHDFAPEAKEQITSDFGRLSYWINQSKVLGYDKFRILIAEDDFLNSQEDIYEGFEDDSIYLRFGGHYGFRDQSWYFNFLKEAYLN
ncbi:MAG: hypothetical protein H6622_00600 [Halobacteriovoraceae bacterium]|nr:hypothetical protein [Halobacteriovoraceae bacterium]